MNGEDWPTQRHTSISALVGTRWCARGGLHMSWRLARTKDWVRSRSPAALLRNGTGRLTTFDVNPDSGYLISGKYADVVTRILGDSLKGLRDLDGPVEFFLHDSLHAVEHEWGELEAVAPILAPDALVLSDNAHVSDVLPRWAESTGRRFSYFQERPKDHWYPGGGIGVAR